MERQEFADEGLTGASLLAIRAGLAVSVSDGGPDTWAATTGNDLEIDS